MENKLQYLYALQQIDLKLDDLEELKGDLPSQILEITERLETIKQKIKEFEETIKSTTIKSDNADVEKIDLTEKIEKYNKQKYEVKTNKQYDALTREIENAEKLIEQLTKDIEVYEGIIGNTKADLETTKTEFDKLMVEFEEKQAELETISKENEELELRYQHEREKLLVRMEKNDIAAYERIRKAKEGKAVVAVKRNACGGCFNTIPAQKIVELRQNNKIFTCEYCGRILVSDLIVEMSKNLI